MNVFELQGRAVGSYLARITSWVDSNLPKAAELRKPRGQLVFPLAPETQIGTLLDWLEEK